MDKQQVAATADNVAAGSATSETTVLQHNEQHGLSHAQLKKLVGYMSYATSPNGVTLLSSIYDLALDVGLDVEIAVAHRHAATQLALSKKLRLLSPTGFVLLDVYLRHRAYFVHQAEQYGARDYVASGDWWGFASSALAIQLAAQLCKFTSNKKDHTAAWSECEQAVREFWHTIDRK